MSIQDLWFKTLGGKNVNRIPVGRASGQIIPRNWNAIAKRQEPSHEGVLHTAEGESVKGAISTLVEKGGAAYNWLIDLDGEYYQLRADASSALRGDQNRYAQIQVCLVTRVPTTPALWLPPAKMLESLAVLMRYYSQEPEGIPLIEPPNVSPTWEDFKGKSWAVANNPRRLRCGRSDFWPNAPGWYTHVEIWKQQPTNHHDCFALRRKEILTQSASLPIVEATFVGQTPHGFLTLQRGSTGSRVKQAQHALKLLRYDLGKSGPNRDGVDGGWGPIMDVAVVAFRLRTVPQLPRLAPPQLDEAGWNALMREAGANF